MGGVTSEEIDWQTLDKTKFVFVGAGLFSGVTTLLYPLSVVKTQQMALANVPRGLRGAKDVAVNIVKADGVRGLYRGFGTTIFGLVPARGIYLTTLEAVKDAVRQNCEQRGLGPAETAAIASSMGGGIASLTTQSVIVPVDVVTQRLMVAGGSRSGGSGQSRRLDPAAVGMRDRRLNGWQMARNIVRAEGMMGLYRGFGLSIVTFVPSSALWWGAYGGYQKLIWQQLDRWRDAGMDADARPTGQVMTVQTASSMLAGLTSACFTNPLDVIKTRLQVTEGTQGAKRPSFASTLSELRQSDGLRRGLWRGVGPRILSSMLWGTAMINTYEYLKRICAKPAED